MCIRDREDNTLRIDLSYYITDIEGDTLTVDVEAGNAEVLFPSGTNVVNLSDSNTADDFLMITPLPDFNGAISLKITALDGSAGCEDSSTIDVLPVNDDPVIDGVAIYVAVVGDYLTARASASDIDGDTVSYVNVIPGSTLSGVNIGIDSGNGIITSFQRLPAWTEGVNTLEVIVEDSNGARASYVKYFIVEASSLPNNAPVLLNNFGVIETNEDEAVRLNLADYFSDPDGDDLTVFVLDDQGGFTYQLSNGSPFVTDGSTTSIGVVNLDDSNTLDDFLTITPPLNYGNDDVFIRVTVVDPYGESASDTMTYRIFPVNDAPVIERIDITQAEEGKGLAGDIYCTDPDIGDNITYSLVSSTHPQAKVTTLGTIYSDDPLASGSTVDYTITVRCCDDSNACDEKTKPFEVQRPPYTPGLDPFIRYYERNEGQMIQFTVINNGDPNPADTTIVDSPNLPANATLDPNTGLFSWLLSYDDGGNGGPGTYIIYNIDFTEIDNHNARGPPISVTIKVWDSTPPP